MFGYIHCIIKDNRLIEYPQDKCGGGYYIPTELFYQIQRSYNGNII